MLCRGCVSCAWVHVCAHVHPAVQRVSCAQVHVCASCSAEGVCCTLGCMCLHTCAPLHVCAHTCAPLHVCTHMCIPLCREYCVLKCMCVRTRASCCASCLHPAVQSVSCVQVHVCAHVCIPLCRGDMLCTAACMHTYAPCSAEHVLCTHICEHTHVHPSLQRLYVAHTHASRSAEALCISSQVSMRAHTCVPLRSPFAAPHCTGWGSFTLPLRAGFISPRLQQPPFPRCPPEPDIYILIFSKGGNALRCKCLHCGCT